MSYFYCIFPNARQDETRHLKIVITQLYVYYLYQQGPWNSLMNRFLKGFCLDDTNIALLILFISTTKYCESSDCSVCYGGNTAAMLTCSSNCRYWVASARGSHCCARQHTAAWCMKSQPSIVSKCSVLHMTGLYM